ncbi:MAG: MMPL family transporter [Alcanivoracaceae bacterium]|nr:MMPL family transporter [Alcanivoracaceae bacterium]
MLDKYFSFITRHRWAVLATWLLILFGAVLGAGRLSFSSDYRVFFGPDNPQLTAFEALQSEFDSSDNVLIAIAPKQGSVFNRDTLAALEYITEESWRTPYSSRVDSLNNYQYTRVAGDDIVVENMVPPVSEMTDARIQQLQNEALSEKQLVNRLLAADGEVGAVNITIRLPGKMREMEVPEVAVFIRDLVSRAELRFPQQTFYMSGQIMMNATLVDASQHDMTVLFPITLLLILVGMMVFTRSIAASFSTLLVTLGAIIGALGSAGWLGISLSPPSASAPTIILTIVVADCMHLLSTYYAGLRRGDEKHAAMKTALTENFRAIYLTSLTTMAGFMTLNFSDSPPFRDLGNISALGVFVAWLMTVSFLPVWTLMMPSKTKATRAAKNHAPLWPVALAFMLDKHRRVSLVALIGLIALMFIGLPKNTLDDTFYDYFGESFPVRQANDFLFENLTGIATLEYELNSGEKNGISDPEFLQKIEAFSNWYEQQEGVYHVSVFTDVLKRINRNLHGDDPQRYRLPDTREEASQYTLLYELSMPFGLQLSNQVKPDHSAMRMVVTMKKMSSQNLMALEDRAQLWLQQQDMQSLTGPGVSPDMMFAHIGERNNRTLLVGVVIALVLISALLLFVFRSVRIGIISLAPNLMPVGIAFAGWGLLVGEVGLSLSVIGTMTLGIVVDDTVHFLSRYMVATREKGLSKVAAIEEAFRKVGRALIGTTVTLVVGFMVLALSPFKLNSDMGLMTAVTLAIALALDMLLLPVLLLVFDRVPERQSAKRTALDGVSSPSLPS